MTTLVSNAEEAEGFIRLLPQHFTSGGYRSLQLLLTDVDREVLATLSSGFRDDAGARTRGEGRDRALAATVSSHFRGLIDQGLLSPLPMA